jgi:hypothetical protein
MAGWPRLGSQATRNAREGDGAALIVRLTSRHRQACFRRRRSAKGIKLPR